MKKPAECAGPVTGPRVPVPNAWEVNASNSLHAVFTEGGQLPHAPQRQSLAAGCSPQLGLPTHRLFATRHVPLRLSLRVVHPTLAEYRWRVPFGGEGRAVRSAPGGSRLASHGDE